MAKRHKNLHEFLHLLPKHSYSLTGVPMEPVSLIIFGSKRSILKAFGNAGWFLADSINFSSVVKTIVTSLFDSSYKTGPVSPSFINGRRQHMALERPTRSDSFRRRHHLRLWKSGRRLNGKPVWIGTISYDRSIGHYHHSILPTHHISSKLNSEENFLARTFRIARPAFVRFSVPEKGLINNGDPYVWDGHALVLDLTKK